MSPLTIPVDTEFAEVHIGAYTLELQPADDGDRAPGYHLAAYPTAVLAALPPGADYPEPVAEFLLPRTWNVTPQPRPGAAQ